MEYFGAMTIRKMLYGVWRAIDRWAIVALLGLSLVLNLRLLFPNRMHFHWYSLSQGSSMPTLNARDLSGSEVDVTWRTDGKATLVYLFAPRCIWCQRNAQSIDLLVAALGPQYRVIGLSNTSVGLAEYVKRRGIDYPVYSTTTRSIIERGTPTTYVVSPQGVIQEIWLGAYAGSVKTGVESRFGVKLPMIRTNGSGSANTPAALVPDALLNRLF